MEDLEKQAKELRKKVLDLGLETGVAHFGGSFSEIEILIALFKVLMKPEDKFILSKGHACNPLYLLLKEKGFNPKIQDHPDLCQDHGICCTTGSLGHGLPMGIGMAFARKKLNKPGKIYVLMGDGECQEGTTWESSLLASKYNLDNLVVIVDHNKIQALDKIDDALPLGDLKVKFEAFGLSVSRINGHSFPELISALQKESTKPKIIIADTIKGKGISFMENDPKWHARAPDIRELKKAYEELK